MNDTLKHSSEDCLQLTLNAIKKFGLKPNGDLVYLAHSAANDFNV